MSVKYETERVGAPDYFVSETKLIDLARSIMSGDDEIEQISIGVSRENGDNFHCSFTRTALSPTPAMIRGGNDGQ